MRSKSIPLPAALLALSVAVCLGAAGASEAASIRSGTLNQAEQRETLEHLLDAIQQAARKLTDQLAGQAAHLDAQRVHAMLVVTTSSGAMRGEDAPTTHFLREALLNLPPPGC